MPELCLNGNCTNTDGSYICDCNEGFNRYNSYCKDIDECIVENFCGVDGVCYNKKGGWECECATGYISRPHSAYITNIGNECVDIDECKEYEGLCKENEICVNTEGTYFCEKCRENEIPRIDKHGRMKCKKRKCLKQNPCENFSECVDSSDRRGFLCICKDGYEGETCENDIDECLSGPCKGDETCINIIGGYECKVEESKIVVVESRFSFSEWLKFEPLTRGSDMCESLNKTAKVGVDCEEDAEICRTKPCTFGCDNVPGHCPCLPMAVELDIIQCTIAGSMIILILVLVWFCVICYVTKTIRQKKVQAKHNASLYM